MHRSRGCGREKRGTKTKSHKHPGKGNRRKRGCSSFRTGLIVTTLYSVHELISLSHRECNKRDIICPVPGQRNPEPEKWQQTRLNKTPHKIALYWYRTNRGWIWCMIQNDARGKIIARDYYELKFRDAEIWLSEYEHLNGRDHRLKHENRLNTRNHMLKHEHQLWSRICCIRMLLCVSKFRRRSTAYLVRDVIKIVASYLLRYVERRL